MPSLTDLSAAGARAASQPVLPGPEPTQLAHIAKRRRARKTMASGAFAFSALALLAAPFVVGSLAADGPQSVVATGPSGDPVAPALDENALTLDENDGLPEELPEDGAETQPREEDPLPAPGPGNSAAEVEPLEPAKPWGFHADKRHFMMGFDGDFSFTVDVYVGPEAAERAARAEADATETVEHRGETVWIRDLGEQRSVSALVGEETFVTVTGPTDELDHLLDMATNGSPFNHEGMPGVHRFAVPSEEWLERLEEDLQSMPDFDELLPPEFQERFKEWTEDDFWDEDFPGDFFEGCLKIDTDGDGEADFSLKHLPDCEAEN